MSTLRCTAALGAGLLLLAACASQRAYQPPTAGKTTRVRFVTDGIMKIIPAGRCVDEDTPGAGIGPVAQSSWAYTTALNWRRLNMPGGAKVQESGLTFSELRVRADEPLLVTYLHSQSEHGHRQTTTYTCRAPFLFVPKEGVDYMVLAQTTRDGRWCGSAVRAIGDQSGEFSRYVKIANQYDEKACGVPAEQPPADAAEVAEPEAAGAADASP